MTATKPLVLLIHGCFGTPAAFNRLVPCLEQAGCTAQSADYPSTNPENPFDVTAQKDIDHIRNEYLLPLIEKDGTDVVLVVHSFGGVIGGAAAVGLSKTDRMAQHLEGGVLGLVYIAGNIVHEGQTLVESAGGQWPPWLIKDKPREGLAVIEPLMETLCHDCDASLEPEVRAASVPQGYQCLVTKVSAPCWAEKGYSGRLGYVRTDEDRINPAFAQDLWIEGTGVQWSVVNMHTSHAPYFSQPGELSRIIVRFCESFEAL